MKKIFSFPFVFTLLVFAIGVALQYLIYSTGHFTGKLTFLEFLTMNKAVIFE